VLTSILKGNEHAKEKHYAPNSRMSEALLRK
jgi:hypothetical protein